MHPRDFLVAHRHKRTTDKIRKPKDYDNNPRRVKDHETYIEAAERKRVSAIMMERQRVSELRKVGAGRIR